MPQLPAMLVDTRMYQARASMGGYSPLTSQTYKLSTANLTDEEKWVSGFAKVYPGFEFALLQSSLQRVQRSAKPARFVFGKAGQRSLEVLQYGAFNEGDGKVPGSTIVVEVNLDFGKPEALSLAIENIVVEDGKTYFFALPKLRFSPVEYVQFLRPGAPLKAFEGLDHYLIFAFSVQLNPSASASSSVDETRANELQTGATRKVQPEVPQALTKAGLGGSVRVHVEISRDGRVAHAYLLHSSFPEMNHVVLAAARQWEFSASQLGSGQGTLPSIIVFEFPPPPTPAPAKSPAGSN